jgi:hypothetical protein
VTILIALEFIDFWTILAMSFSIKSNKGKEVLVKRVYFSKDIRIKWLNLDVDDKKRGIGHMIIRIHGV